MTVIEALILGLVQGASEFLPISSSGHLLLLEKLGVGQESVAFNVALHVATLLAVVIALRKQIWAIARHPLQKTTLYILLACLPTVAIAAIFKYALPDLLSGKLLGFGFTLTACLLIAAEKLKPSKSALLSPKTSILTGFFQGVAVLPGVSRSGATMSALTLCGVDKEQAANFSFLLSIPIIVGSAAVEGFDVISGATPLAVAPLPLAVGFVAAFAAGIISVSFFLKMLKNHSLLPFAVYTLLLGMTITLLPLFGVTI